MRPAFPWLPLSDCWPRSLCVPTRYCISPDLTICKKMSAFNTRTIKNPNMFVRTHVAFYFVSLLLSDILQCEFQFIQPLLCMSSARHMGLELSGSILPLWRTTLSPLMFVLDAVADILLSFAAISSIINSTWVREGAIVYGSLCTAQGTYGELFTLGWLTHPQGVLRHMSDVGIALW